MRSLRLSEAVALMRDTDQPNFPLAGVKSVKEFLDSVAAGPGNMTSYQAEWERLSGVGEGSAVNHVHRNLCEVIRLMHSWDQVDLSMLASAELLVRWMIQTEIAVERNPRHPDYSGLDIVISAPVNAAGRASTSRFNTWVTDRLKERATIWKQERLYREEQKQVRKGDGKGGDSSDPTNPKRRPKKPKGGGIRSRDRRHGDPFPLPCDPGGLGDACDAARLQQVFDSVRALNQLAAANLNSRRAQGHDLPPEGHLRPTAVQRWMLQNVARRVEAYGARPTDLTEESSLSEILDSRDHYGMEPKNLASFDFDKVKILHRRVHVRPIRRELPPAALGYIRRASDLIERDEAELEKDRAEGVGFSPYWDPRLRRSRDLRKQLYQRLSQQGLLTWRRRLKGRAGIFVVKKKDGLQRLIIDARAANRAHRLPPTTRLGSSRCMADLDLSDPRLKASGFGGVGSGTAASPAGLEGDVGDCFYNFTIPELASWFGFEDRFDTNELESMGCRPATIWDDAEGAETQVEDGELLYPCMAAVCMGWSWALYFANEAVTYRVEKTLEDGADQIMREMQPAPVLKPGKCVTGVYVDNVQVIGGCGADAVKQMTEIEKSFKEDNIPFDVEPGGGFEMQTLGLVYHWRERRLRHVARRVWRTYLAGHALLRRRKLHGHALQCWLGHVVNLNQLCPEAMSALNACYRFIEESLEAPKRVWPSVKSEIRCAMNLLFLMEVDLGANYSDQVYCGDSSSRGYALHVTKGEPEEIREAWRWRERWRYRDVPLLEGQVSEGLNYVRGDAPRTAAGPQTAFGQDLRSRAEARPRPAAPAAPAKGARVRVALDSGIPAVADGWTKRRRYHLVAADRWRWQDEHINLKEARVALMGLRRHCRSVRFLGSKLLTLSDSQVTVGAFEKGRSSAGLQALCRRAAAYRLGGQITWRLRYIETDRNPSDFDSRRWDAKRPASQGPTREQTPAAAAVAPVDIKGPSSRQGEARKPGPPSPAPGRQQPLAARDAPAELGRQRGRGESEDLEVMELDPIARLRGLAKVTEVHFDMSMYGTAYRKPTRLLTNVEALRALGDRPRIPHKHAIRNGLLQAAGRQPKARGQALRCEDGARPEVCCQAADAYLGGDPVIQQRPPGKGRPRQPSAPRRVGAIRVPRREALLMATVTNATLERYAAAVQEFEVYAKTKKLDLQPLSRLDDSLAQYFVDLYDDGFGVWEGRNTLYGYRLLRLKTTGKVDLPKALASLKGWVKRSPGRMRLPLPDIIVDDIAMDLAEHDLPLMGAAVELQTDAYLRPSEIVELRQGQILPPAPAAKLGAHYGVVIAPSEWHEVTKTGGQDDSLLVGDVARPWLTNVLRLLHQPMAPDSLRLFDFSLAKYEREVKKSADRLGYSSLGVCPHVFRHSGASNDKAHNRRTLKEVQKRGRWASSASVARYEKGALILQQLRKIPQQKQRMAASRSKRLPQLLLDHLRKR
ncbi:unnamed protein product [Prorocentrum cordatum]|uniref:Tyr recombinase domain-containing protein n=1 Tax=Prorocentrum cordatum TaxID=2364126 RepID=A0ABN9R948_9DINO|nr:unnamed protein product [Polarella glacialis]